MKHIVSCVLFVFATHISIAQDIFNKAKAALNARDTDVVSPSPSRLWVFIDEHPASINDGGFGFEMPDNFDATKNQGWVDYPAAFHNGASALSFIDGHAEVHKWIEGQTLALGKPNVKDWNNLPRGNFAKNRDIWWMAQRTSSMRQGADPWD